MGRILLCTADESCSRSLAQLLRAAAYDVVTADGPGGLAHIEHDTFDAVVTDLHMPGADGFAILDAVRAKAPQTPVIVMSGSAQISDAARAIRLGARDFLAKPVDVKSLEEALGHAVTTAKPPAPGPPRLHVGPDGPSTPVPTPTDRTDLRARLKSVEDRMVADALVRAHGNRNLLLEVDVAERLRRLLVLLKRRIETIGAKQKTDTQAPKVASELRNKGVTRGELGHLRKGTPAQVAEERIEAARASNASELDLHGLGLTRLPPSIGQLTKLQSLNVFGNQLSALPEAIGNLAQLKFLYISENQLTALPDAIGRLSQLQFLSASENRLTVLPDAIGRLSQLHHLDLYSNRLTALPKSLRRLTGLRKLFLQKNPDLGLPPEVLGPAQQLEGDARPANPARILRYYFRTSGSENPWPGPFRGLFGANVRELQAKRDVEGLFQIATDNRHHANNRARHALEELGKQAVAPLMSCVREYYEINANLSFESIATTLSEVGAAIVVPLIRLLEQSNGDIAAIVALGKLKDPRAVPILCALFKMGNPLISTQIATALAAIANEEAVAALMQALEGDYFIARADAVYALGIVGDQSFIPAITKACSDPHEPVRDAAGKALHQITMRSP